MKFSIILLAAGTGKRSGLNYNKIFYKIHGKSLLDYSLDYFINCEDCVEIILVVNKSDESLVKKMYSSMVGKIVLGGLTRQESVQQALKHVKEEYVLVHDSARPFINGRCVDDLLGALVDYDAATLGMQLKDSICKTDGNRLEKTLNRSDYMLIQTPQAFKKSLLIEVHRLAKKDGFTGTDDTSLVKQYSDQPIKIVKGDVRMHKFTTLSDLDYLKVIL
ncbi:MAG: 2-C-methyl-D-erythritol 4-phosphate cytidylyltransferase [Candidatus Izimaplasma sp.]|nr:2-C-methyl-D-erythritol 4-phosphate cytidylyltransferase [Candidatus Izimaplasma bacterium]